MANASFRFCLIHFYVDIADFKGNFANRLRFLPAFHSTSIYSGSWGCEERGNHLATLPRAGVPGVDLTAECNLPIRQASFRGYIDLVKLLLGVNGVDPTAWNNGAIRYAAGEGHVEIVKMLLRVKEVDPTAENNQAVQWASGYGHVEVVKLLLKQEGVNAGANTNISIVTAAENGHLSVVRLLLGVAGVDATANKNAALRLAALNGHGEVVKLLLKVEGVDAADDDNFAILGAAHHGHLAVVKLLLKVDVRVAAEKGYTDVVELLLTVKGVDPTANNNEAIRAARRHGHAEIVGLLSKRTQEQPFLVTTNPAAPHPFSVDPQQSSSSDASGGGYYMPPSGVPYIYAQPVQPPSGPPPGAMKSHHWPQAFNPFGQNKNAQAAVGGSSQNQAIGMTPMGGARPRGAGAEYGEDTDIEDINYEFYSRPNSRPPSNRGSKILSHQSSSQPLMSNASIPSADSIELSQYHQQQQQHHPNSIISSHTHTRHGSEVTMTTNPEERARQQAKHEVEIENAPIGSNSNRNIIASKDGIMPKALYSPEVRNQLAALKSHQPWFLGTVTVIQVITLIVSFVLNNQATGSVIETNPFNVMIGPSPGILIQMGARFVPCIRGGTVLRGALIVCPDGIQSDTTLLNPTTGQNDKVCTLEQICGLGGFHGNAPNQWFRFVLPIFLHGGVLHILFNLLFQVRTGFQMERDFGWWRIGIIYMVSGIGGFVFGGNFNGLTPSVGCSGALFGLLACLVIDLFHNWSLILNPYWELAKLFLTLVVSFLIGMLPYIDNFAHIGGFFCGFFAGLIFMPTIHYSKWDGRVKVGLQIVSAPVLIIILVFLVKGFYDAGNNCPWCKYLNCIPGMPWCDSKWNQTVTLTGGTQ
ncbi:hypothetical protein HDU76_013587 [Blyttiomyces sp. JEL0837]|nr:hypothetical protein HDU76_013587 [Blyttiomyces sp. JEL0837]